MSTSEQLSFSNPVVQRPWDARLARISGKTSRIGHVYDLASDAAVTILLFVAIGVGVATSPKIVLPVPPAALGLLAAAPCAPLFAVWVVIDYRRALQRQPLQVTR
jgi:hypothetical protein